MALYQHTVKAILECNQIEYSFDTDTYLIDNAGSLSQDSKDHLRDVEITRLAWNEVQSLRNSRFTVERKTTYSQAYLRQLAGLSLTEDEYSEAFFSVQMTKDTGYLY